MGGIGSMELIVIFLVILLVFGAKRIPEIARGLGKGIREFKSATREIKDELNVQAPPRPIQPPAQATAPRTDAYQQSAPQPAQPAAQPDSPATGKGAE